MAIYESLPSYIKPEKKTKPTGAIAPEWPKRTSKKKPMRSQMPGHPTDEPRGLSESTTKNNTKTAKPVAKAVSNPLDGKNKGKKVAGNGSARDSLAQGARKATPSPKPKGTDKKVRGQVKK